MPQVRLLVLAVYSGVFALYILALAQGVRAWMREWREDRALEYVVRRLKEKEM
jgi:hypothetical protein